MNRWFYVVTFASAIVSNGCWLDCEYDLSATTGQVSVVPASSESLNCRNDPVEIEVTWSGGSQSITTSDGRNLPRECAASIGLVDGAQVNIQVNRARWPGNTMSVIACGSPSATLLDIDTTACDTVCDEPPPCPAAAPPIGGQCLEDMRCQYDPAPECPAQFGTTTHFYHCVGGAWTIVEKNNCDLCNGACVSCYHCVDAIAEHPMDPIPFCYQFSAMLYDAFWTCACLSGNPCESTCNTAPAGEIAYCNGGMPTAECQTCLMTPAQSGGCLEVFDSCANDFP